MMRLGAALGLVLMLAGAACGGARKDVATTTAPARVAPATEGLRVGVVGPLKLDTAGIVTDRGTLAQVASASLVIVSGPSATLTTVAAAARAHPSTHYALVGQATKPDRVRNLLGLVLSDDQAALLAGIVAGYAAADLGGAAPRVAWVGPEERGLARAFERGVHRSLPGAVVLDEWSSSIPARCKEAALTAIGRGAMVVMAHDGICAEAAIAGARQQNVAGLQLGDFEFPAVAANLVARDAVAGVFRGGEDLTFGAASGATGIGILDPRIPLDAVVRARAAAQVLAGGGK
jgi:basic membrane lipoprotein Med (substrate-binding protein (PBP1-ABC) superfamily)